MTGYTIHPFGDEWLWTNAGDAPLVCESVEHAASTLADHRAAVIVGNAGPEGAELRALMRRMWAAVYEYDGPVDGGGDLAAVIAPDGRVYDGEGERAAAYDAVRPDGSWPEDDAA
jgi:hypothetical protein